MGKWKILVKKYLYQEGIGVLDAALYQGLSLHCVLCLHLFISAFVNLCVFSKSVELSVVKVYKW